MLDFQNIGIVFPDDGIRGPVTLAWSGDGLDGEPLSNGAYIVKVESVDSLGITTVVTGTASILRSGSTVTVRVFNEAGELVWSSTNPGLALDQSEVEIQGDTVNPSLPPGSPGSSLNIALGTGTNITWPGTDQNGHPLANGSYLVEVRIESAGQEWVITGTVTVLHGGETPGGVLAAPNPVSGTGPVEIRASAAAGQIVYLKVKAYTVSGELVRRTPVQKSPT